MKKVLFITYIFPPTAGAGVQRGVKFVKYLPYFNWQASIITPRKAAEEARDETFLKEIPPQAKVYRTYSFEPRTWSFLRRLWRRKIEEIDARTDKENFEKPTRQSFLKKMIDFLRILFFIPDDSIGWLPFILGRGYRSIKEDKIDLIFASAPPYTVLVGGVLLKKLTKKPLVVDFRDAWTQYPEGHKYYKTPSWRRKIDSKLERWVLEKADKIICVSQPMIDYFREKYELEKDKFSFIPNGYDGEDFQVLKKIPHSKFTITYTGSFYGKITPLYFLKAIGNFLKKNKELIDQINLIFVGHLSEGIKKLAKKINPGCQLNFLGYLSHQKSINYLVSSSLNLLIIAPGPESKPVYTGKIFEYLASGVPILALVPKDGVAAELIRKTNTGIVVDPENIDEIEKAIEFLYQKWQKGEEIIKPNWLEIQKYERKKLTQKLAEILNQLVGWDKNQN